MLGLVFSHWITAPLRKLTRHAEAVAAGRRPPPPQLPGRHFRRLGETIEEMRDALEGRKQFESYVQNLSHEMMSPVAAIRGASELLAAENLPAERRTRLLENIQTESARLHQLGDQMLALASLESRKHPTEQRPIHLHALLANIAADHQSAASAAGITLTLESADAPEIIGDAGLLKMAISNLVGNAVDFSPNGGHVLIRTRRDGTYAVIEIDDEGPGIPEFARERAFERFFSLPRPRSGRKSSGLGLCLARETAGLHHGEVSLENRPEGGARAAIRLPTACKRRAPVAKR